MNATIECTFIGGVSIVAGFDLGVPLPRGLRALRALTPPGIRTEDMPEIETHYG
jgi:hypothetical protein